MWALDILNETFAWNAKAENLDALQMCARAALVYVALIVMVRLGKKRFLGKASAFDIILGIMVGSIAARAITGGAPLLASLCGIAALIAMHWLFSAISRNANWFGDVIKGEPVVVVKNGRIDRRALWREHMSKDDLDEDLRREGVSNVREVAEARMERNGQLSVLKRR